MLSHSRLLTIDVNEPLQVIRITLLRGVGFEQGMMGDLMEVNELK